MGIQLGQILNEKYKIIKKLQEGGQASIFLAVSSNESLSFTKEVAIKLFDKEEEREFVVSEAALLSEINHPNIAKIYDVGTFEGHPYLVLEYINGLNLKELQEKILLKRLEVSPSCAFSVLEQVLDALVYAHNFKDKSILHRDISPSNIMISQEGFVKLLDFGISGISAEKLAGKPAYLPTIVLERKQPYSNKTDLYSLAAVIFEFVTLKKVRKESDLNLDLLLDKRLKNVLKLLINSDGSDEKQILRATKRISNEEESGLDVLVSIANDESYLVDNTIKAIPIKKSIPSRNIKNLKKSFLITASLVLTFFSFFYFKHNSLASNMKFYLESEHSRAIKLVEAPSLTLDRPTTKDERALFTLNACEKYCYQGLMNLAIGHKDFYDQASKDPSFGVSSKSFDDYFDLHRPLFKETRDHFDAYSKTCKEAGSCIAFKGIFTHFNILAPSSMSEPEYMRNLKRIFDGSDSIFKNVAKTLNSGKFKPDFKNYNYTVEARQAGTMFSTAFYDGKLDRDACLNIGDEAYLMLARHKKTEDQHFLFSDFDLVILNKKIQPQYHGNKQKIPLFKTILSIKDLIGTTVCHYQRNEGRLSALQIWDI